MVGKHCESGDIVVRDVDLPSDIARGDLLAVPATGAYGRSMANNYNALLRPAVVAVRDGEIARAHQARHPRGPAQLGRSRLSAIAAHYPWYVTI